VYELLELDRGLTDAIRRNDSIGFAAAARARPGFMSLTQSAIQLAAKGITTLSEAIGVTSGLEQGDDPLLADALAEQTLKQERA
jgi:MSHA biogenesis protein MshE